jgi:hypothetical protein
MPATSSTTQPKIAGNHHRRCTLIIIGPRRRVVRIQLDYSCTGVWGSSGCVKKTP